MTRKNPPKPTKKSTTPSVTFWGVRGSLASPGASTARYGGNTSCVEVSVGDTTLLFDAGTGIRACGNSLMRRGRKNIHLLFSHLHWDHIQGFPFFVPAYVPGTRLSVLGPAPKEELQGSLSRQMCPPNFPVRLEDMKSDLSMHEFYPGTQRPVGEVTVQAARLNHPGGVLGYRVETGSHTVVYTTDHEHGTDADERLVELAQGADLLIYDAMYTPDEYEGKSGPSKVGWGHSTYEKGVEVAKRAGVDQLALFHHDPTRTDEEVDELVQRARMLFPNVIAAQEGVTLLPGSVDPNSSGRTARAA